ncbi:MAG TPA: hypothetical protein VJ521_01360 [Acidobacteriota bacterium]|nr:hypothetical protein [Acidobacteriota bacterium]
MADRTMSNAIDFNNNELWKRFLTKAREEVPTRGTLRAMLERAMEMGALHYGVIERAWAMLAVRVTAETPWQYIECLRKTHNLSLHQIASELGVSRAQLTPLKQSRTPLSKESLASFCRDFSRRYPEYPRGKLMRLLKRAI